MAKNNRAGVGRQVTEFVIRGSGPQIQWETRYDNIVMRNPAWNGFVKQIAVKAARDLGTKSDARAAGAKLVKARLWSAEACMPPHKEWVIQTP